MRESRVFYKLGVKAKRVTDQFYGLEQMISQSGINPYSTLNYKKDSLVHNYTGGECGFSFMKLREAQNLDWAEDAIAQGLEHEQNSNFERALEFYVNAVELDPLNKQALQLKGLLLKRLERHLESEESLKQALKLMDSDDEGIVELETVL